MRDVLLAAAMVWFGTGIVVKPTDRAASDNDRPIRAGERIIVIHDLAIIRPSGTAERRVQRFPVRGDSWRQGVAFVVGNGRDA